MKDITLHISTPSAALSDLLREAVDESDDIEVNVYGRRFTVELIAIEED